MPDTIRFRLNGRPVSLQTGNSWVPRIATVLVPNDDLAPQGGGEPAIITMGAVVANAIFDATGARMLRTPMTPERVLAEIRRG